ncbi:hypothetical protein A5673_21690 [Mycobacterium sp. E3198]|nr:hypothetical protein A5673_21690 [Mycobacterium sp. E3198]
MEVAGLSDERATRPAAGHASGGVRDRRGRMPRSSAVRPGPVNVRQGGAMPGVTVNRPARDVTLPAAVVETADHRQADYFRRVLVQSRRHIDHRLGEYQKAIAAAEAAGDAEAAGSLRRMASSEERERQVLDGMIENLQRRFPHRSRPATR